MIPVSAPYLTAKARENVLDCIDSTWISSSGKYIEKFENEFKSKFDYNYALTTSNGTTAIHLALEAFGVGASDEVIVPDLTFAATINAVIHAKATPVIVGVDEQTWNISIEEILKSITEKTKAIIVVHLYGIPFDVELLKEKLLRDDIIIIEDCAEALGAKIKNRFVGSFGDAITFSFYGNKVITTGEGGMIAFKENTPYERAKIMRDHGMSPGRRYFHEYVGFNYRMTNIQAAIGISQLEAYTEIENLKNIIFSRYDEVLLSKNFFRPRISEVTECPWIYTVLVPENKCRESLIEYLRENEIDTRRIFYPMSSMKIYREYLRSSDSSAENISNRGISLPSSASLSREDQSFIILKIMEWLEK